MEIMANRLACQCLSNPFGQDPTHLRRAHPQTITSSIKSTRKVQLCQETPRRAWKISSVTLFLFLSVLVHSRPGDGVQQSISFEPSRFAVCETKPALCGKARLWRTMAATWHQLPLAVACCTSQGLRRVAREPGPRAAA